MKGIRQTNVLGRVAPTGKKLVSNDQWSYYQILYTGLDANWIVVYADNNFCSIYVKENAQVRFKNLLFSYTQPGGGADLSIRFDNSQIFTEDDAVSGFTTIDPLFSKGVFTNFDVLRYSITGFGGAGRTATRQCIVGVRTSDIISIPNSFGAQIKKL